MPWVAARASATRLSATRTPPGSSVPPTTSAAAAAAAASVSVLCAVVMASPYPPRMDGSGWRADRDAEAGMAAEPGDGPGRFLRPVAEVIERFCLAGAGGDDEDRTGGEDRRTPSVRAEREGSTGPRRKRFSGERSTTRVRASAGVGGWLKAKWPSGPRPRTAAARPSARRRASRAIARSSGSSSISIGTRRGRSASGRAAASRAEKHRSGSAGRGTSSSTGMMARPAQLGPSSSRWA